MVTMVTGHGPTEKQLQEAVAMVTKELDNAHCVRTGNDVVCDGKSLHAKVVSVTASKSQRHLAAMHRPTPRTIKLSQSAVFLEKVAKSLMNSPDHFTVDQLGQVESRTITGQCDEAPEASEAPAPTSSCEPRWVDDKEFRTANGCANNNMNSLWGSPEQCLKRMLDPQYGNGINEPRTAKNGDSLPNARHVSLVMHEDMRKSSHEISHMLMQFGQFMSHEITMTAAPDEDVSCPCEMGAGDLECFNIPIPENDPDFPGRSCIEFIRSSACPNKGCSMGPRQQFDQVTAFVDASNVYGDSEEDMASLRDSDGFLLKSRPNPPEPTKKELLPEAPEDWGFECEGPANEKCSQAGDTRVNQQPALTSLHTVFMREHNRIAKELSVLNKDNGWGDDRVFFETRKIVGALLQKIAGFFSGYNPTVNPGIYNGFATAAYRFGHSVVQNGFDRYDSDFNSQCPIKLAYSLDNPTYVLDGAEGGPDSIIRGLTTQPRQDADRFMVSGLTKFLFADPPGSDNGIDLAAVNIQRGRDHGLPGYNAWREKCGLPRAPRFRDLAPQISDETTREKLKSLYSHVDDIDLFVGGLSEEAVPGGIVGPTFACLIGMQFQDIRKGDRFWFENTGQFTEEQLEEIKKTSLARILCDNTDGTTHLQPDVFKLPTQPGNERVSCSSLPEMDLNKWKE
ncbi:PXDN [Branchiostoma lanceolatum]|uniref:PXDN protein n=1 Tax=Branchiostoma lanceolatum TaxID=7740 RepID=A0A8J9YQY3_BRALA|nr:PXDN [Branchiostoma lanceolatum]